MSNIFTPAPLAVRVLESHCPHRATVLLYACPLRGSAEDRRHRAFPDTGPQRDRRLKMGGKQRMKDRMYITAKEWASEGGGYKDRGRLPFRKLPFHCCAITFTGFEDPVCTADGTVFDIVNVVPYIQKFGKHPVTGQPLKLGDLIRLHFHKNGDNEYCCPVTGKVFTEHTHIVAVRPSGNVYCWEAVDELNVKPKHWKDLLTDQPFTRKDIIHIQDPMNLSGKVLDDFDHVKNDLRVTSGPAQAHNVNLAAASDDMKRTLAAIGAQTEAKPVSEQEKKQAAKRALEEAERSAAERRAGSKGAETSKPSVPQLRPSAAQADKPKASDPRLRAPERRAVEMVWRPGAATWNTDEQKGDGRQEESRLQKLLAIKRPHALVESSVTTGAMSMSFTSTTATVATSDQRTLVRKERRVDKKGYVRLRTNLGDLNLELHCDSVPRTCENFLTLCGVGYYDGVAFHRSIKNFMIQGGDPTGTGKGGESIYGKTFKDEINTGLKHAGRGVLSMANSGPHTNGSQFFITYKSAPHLDGKHSIFGRVVGGLETLAAMERVPTDEEDRPLQEIKILSTEVFTDPFLEQEKQEVAAKEEAAKKEALRFEDQKRGAWFSTGRSTSGVGGAGASAGEPSASKVGAAALEAARQAQVGEARPAKKPKTQYGDFSGW